MLYRITAYSSPPKSGDEPDLSLEVDCAGPSAAFVALHKKYNRKEYFSVRPIEIEERKKK
ncbi:MAG: hypothetical protein WC455_11640 [Dehalococcoidia bacterium]